MSEDNLFGASVLRGLTLWRPWAASIVHGPKRVENRTWPVPAALRASGLWLAIHAGQHWDDAGAAFIRRLWPEAAASIPHGTEEGIVGIARLSGMARLSVPVGWEFGPWVWRLDSVRALAEPLPAKGAMGLWRLTPAIEEALLPLCVQAAAAP